MLTQRLLVLLTALLLAAPIACKKEKKPVTKVVTADDSAAKKESAPAQPAKTTEKAPEKKAETTSAKKEVVFDIRNPPAGYTNCHRNHCHKVGGGVASYKQVMAEMGATKIIGVPKRKPMPKAPADVAAIPKDAQKTKSGLAFKVLNKGDGKNKPGANSVVQFHFTFWTADGKPVDSSVARGRAATVPIGRIPFPGLREGLQLMSVGEERRMWLSEALAYQGKAGRPKGMIVFDVELLAIK